MGIIQETICRYLDNKYVDRVIVSGMDGSGKSSMLSPLVVKYNYMKYVYNYDMNPIEFDKVTNTIQLFDRHPIIDYYIYGEHPDTKEFKQVSFNRFRKLTSTKIPKTLYIIYLHTMFLDEKTSEPDWVKKYSVKYYDRYLDIIHWIDILKYPIIVVTDKSFFLKHGIY